MRGLIVVGVVIVLGCVGVGGWLVYGFLKDHQAAQPAAPAQGIARPASGPATRAAGPTIETARASIAVLKDGPHQAIAVCVGDAGIFVTAERIRTGQQVTLILDAGSGKERPIEATCVARTTDRRASLLLAPEATSVRAIPLDTDARPVPAQTSLTLVAWFSRFNRDDNSRSPPELVAGPGTVLQHDGASFSIGVGPALAQGLVVSGSFALNDRGELVGLLSETVADRQGNLLDSAMSASQLRRLLSSPFVLFNPPAVEYIDRHRPVTVPVAVARPIALGGVADGTVEMELSPPGRPPQVVKAVPVPATGPALPPVAAIRQYHLTFAPLTGPELLPVRADVNGVAIDGTTVDHAIKVGDRTIRLSAIKLLLRDQVRLADGTIVRGAVSGLGSMDVAAPKPGAARKLDFAQADRVVFESAITVPYSLKVVSGQQKIDRSSALLVGDAPPLPEPDSTPIPPQPVSPLDLNPVPEAVASNRPLAGEITTTNQAKKVRLNLRPGSEFRTDKTVVLWSRDGQSAYLLDPDPRDNAISVIRRVAIPSLIEERTITITGRDMKLSAHGLVVAGFDRVWILDEKTLEVRKMIVLGPGEYAASLVCGKDGDFAYDFLDQNGRSTFRALDLAAGRFSREVPIELPATAPAAAKVTPDKSDEFETTSDSSSNQIRYEPVASPDGRSVFAPVGRRIVRYDAVGKSLRVADAGPVLRGRTPIGLAISPDGQWVVLIGGRDPAGPAPDKTLPNAGTTSVYRTSDLRTAVAHLTSHDLPVIAFASTRVFLWHRLPDTFAVLNPATGKPDAGPIPPAGGMIFPHPDGLRMFQSDGREGLCWVELPGAKGVYDPAAAHRGAVGDKSPTPEATGKPLSGIPRKVDGASVTPLRIDAEALLPQMPFSADGRAAYLLDRRGLLRKIDVATLVEERRLDLGVACIDLARSAEGLLALTYPSGELFVLDETTLVVKRRIAVLPATDPWIASAPTQLPIGDDGRGSVDQRPSIGPKQIVAAVGGSVALVRIGGESEQIAVVDLATGRRVNDLYPIKGRRPDKGPFPPFLKQERSGRNEDGPPTGKRVAAWFDLGWFGISALIMTPDGKRVFLSRGSETYFFAVDGVSLVRETSLPTADVPLGMSMLSPDGRYALRFPRRSFQQRPGQPPSRETEVEVISVADSRAAPVAVLPGEDSPRFFEVGVIAAFDPAARQIYTLNGAGQLVVYGPGGVKTAAYAIDNTSEPTGQGQRTAGARSLSSHPNGSQLLALTDRTLYWIRLPAAGGALPKGPDAWFSKGPYRGKRGSVFRG